MFGLSVGEILLIAIIALVLFGNEKLPQNMKKMVDGIRRAKKATSQMQKSWYEIKTDVQRNINFDNERAEITSIIEAIPLEHTVHQEEIDTHQNQFNISIEKQIDHQ